MTPVRLETLRPGARFQTAFMGTTGTLIAKTPSAATVQWDDTKQADGSTAYGQRSQIGLGTEVLPLGGNGK